MGNPTQMLFLSISFQKRWFYFETTFGYVKKHKLFITVFTTIHWVKPAWPAEPIVNLDITNGTLLGDIG